MSDDAVLRAPFPYFGGKSWVAPLVWDALGDVANYVEPFAGSLAVLLSRPTEPKIETVNDLDAYLSNFWRALAADPEQVAFYADWPVNETDLEARHWWLITTGAERLERLRWDAEYYDSQAAGWWVWGLCCWIGSGWCEGKGPHAPPGVPEGGLTRKRPHLGTAGQGIHRQLPHLGTAGQGIYDYFAALSERLRRVRVCCGDWTRVLGPTPTVKQGLTGVFLDPPYAQDQRDATLYRLESTVSAAVREWAVSHGDDPLLRIVLCGYEGEHELPDSWTCVPWKARGGYGSQSIQHDNPNARRERLWLSPHCLKPDRPRALSLWGDI